MAHDEVHWPGVNEFFFTRKWVVYNFLGEPFNYGRHSATRLEPKQSH